MEFCPTLDMIEDYFKKSLRVSQFCRFCDVIIEIHEDDIPDYNASGRYFFKEQKLKLKKEKEESRKAYKLTGT